MLLSICIPTYNRAEYLDDTLHSIVVQDRFNNSFDVEIVISDNCSSDNTQEIANKYVEKYPDKIRYFKNEENIFDANFEKVLSYGKGEFLKLNNDTLAHKENTLDVIVKTIQDNLESRKILFFSNGSIKNITTCLVENLDLFIKIASYNITWIASFGIWKSDFEQIEDFNKNAKLQLVQVDILLRLIDKKKQVYINNCNIFNSVISKSVGGYNIFKVFVENYLTLLRFYVYQGTISQETFKLEKKKLLYKYLYPRYRMKISEKEVYLTLKTNNANKYLIRYFSLYDVLKFNGIIFAYWMQKSIKRIIKRILKLK